MISSNSANELCSRNKQIRFASVLSYVAATWVGSLCLDCVVRSFQWSAGIESYRKLPKVTSSLWDSLLSGVLYFRNLLRSLGARESFFRREAVIVSGEAAIEIQDLDRGFATKKPSATQGISTVVRKRKLILRHEAPAPVEVSRWETETLVLYPFTNMISLILQPYSTVVMKNPFPK